MDKSRKYLESHPWLTFELNLKEAEHNFWMLLGEAASKCEHIAGVPLLPEVANELHMVYLVKGVMATTAIEGNTLTEAQVLQQLEGKLVLPQSQEYLAQEVQNIIDALIAVFPAAIAGIDVNLDLIKRMNATVLKDLPHDEDVDPGKVREHSVTVGHYRGAPPEDCEYLLSRLCEVLNDSTKGSISPIALGILKAIFAHLYLAWIHPFGDGNGRTSRLLEYYILLSAGVSTPSAHLLSNHYNQTRKEYYRQLDQASRSGGNILPFLNYALSGFVEGLKSQIGRIKQQQLEVTWQYYIYEVYKHRVGDVEKRRRDLLIEISKEPQPILIHNLRRNAGIANAYGKSTDRVLARDIQILKDERFLEVKGGKVRARKELIESFLPHSREQLEKQITKLP